MKIFQLHDTKTEEILGAVSFIPAHSAGGLNPTSEEENLLFESWKSYNKMFNQTDVNQFVVGFNDSHMTQLDTVDVEFIQL